MENPSSRGEISPLRSYKYTEPSGEKGRNQFSLLIVSVPRPFGNGVNRLLLLAVDYEKTLTPRWVETLKLPSVRIMAGLI